VLPVKRVQAVDDPINRGILRTETRGFANHENAQQIFDRATEVSREGSRLPHHIVIQADIDGPFRGVLVMSHDEAPCACDVHAMRTKAMTQAMGEFKSRL